MRTRTVALAVALAVLGGACAGSRVAPIGAGGQPFRPQPDEEALWARGVDEERRLVGRVPPYGDPLLEAYLAGIVDRLLPGEARAAGGPRLAVTVLPDPALNALAMPGGRIFVHTGLLSRLDTEAQLAAVLGREVAHVTHRHALRLTRAAGLGPEPDLLPAGGAALGPTASAVLGPGLPLAALASIRGYGRSLEREADAVGLARMVRAGYDPGEAPRAFQRLLRGAEEGGAGLEVFALGRGPRLRERLASVRALVAGRHGDAAAAPGRVRTTDEFPARLRPVVRDNAALDARAGRFELARAQLDRVLAATPGDPIAHLHDGDLYRLQSQRAASDDAGAALAARAEERYERAAGLDPRLAAPYRQLGLLHYGRGQTARARAAFARYLALAPDAVDAPRIREYLGALERAASAAR